MKFVLSASVTSRPKLWLISGTTLLVIATIICLLIQDWFLIDGHRLGGDASQNLRSAINVVLHYRYSEEQISPLVEPGFRREPLPNLLLAVHLKLANIFIPNGLNFTAPQFDPNVLVLAKSINLIYALLLFLGLWVCHCLLIVPAWLASLVAGLVIYLANLFFVQSQVNNLNTELIASVALIWLTALTLKVNQRFNLRLIGIVGLIFGLIALIKSTVAYLAVILLPILALILAGKKNRFWSSFMAISLGFSIAVLPWVARNYYHFKKAVIAQGGGDVLLIRSAFNEMNQSQYKDSFFAYSPKILRQSGLLSQLQITEEDFQCGKRLQFFNRELDCDKIALQSGNYAQVKSFYQRGKRAIPRLLELSPEQKKQLAINKITANPMAHLVVTAPLAWRGLWSFRMNDWTSLLLNFAAYMSLAIAFFIGFIKRKKTWLLISIVPVSYYCVYALISHFLPRYSKPLIPSALLCLSFIVIDVIPKLVLHCLQINKGCLGHRENGF